MLIVADSSPVNYLVRIGHIDLLPRMFGHVVVPPEVLAELTAKTTPSAVREFLASQPSWFSIRTPNQVQTIPLIDAGEQAAIALAKELQTTLLIDDIDGRRAAQARGLRVIGTLGVLEQADIQAMADLVNSLGLLLRTDRLPHRTAPSRECVIGEATPRRGSSAMNLAGRRDGNCTPNGPPTPKCVSTSPRMDQ